MLRNSPCHELAILEAVLRLLSQSVIESARTLHIQRCFLLVHCFAYETCANVASADVR